VAVRDALLAAREPDEALFRGLPAALDVVGSDQTLDDPRAIEAYAERLADAIRELRQNWRKLLQRIEQQLRLAMVTPSGSSLRTDLRVRAEHLVDRILDPRLRAFLLTVGEEGLDDEDWLEAVSLVVLDKPVRAWLDRDWAAFVAASGHLGGQLRRLEALNYEHIASGSTGFTARRVTITNPDGTESSRVIVTGDGDDAAVEEIASRVLEEATRLLPVDMYPALIARLLDDLAGGAESQADPKPNGRDIKYA
jgi:hypothetical protein